MRIILFIVFRLFFYCGHNTNLDSEKGIVADATLNCICIGTKRYVLKTFTLFLASPLKAN